MTRDSDGRRMAKTGTGLVRSTTSAGRRHRHDPIEQLIGEIREIGE